LPLGPGTRLGAYEILTLIGSGGMGEVYRARDSRLNRDVAIKVLPAQVAADHDRLARFEREAQVLASLNHPNIAQIHGVDDSSGTPALVMELVEGATLADRIAKGPIPLDEALPIAKQIADALEAAHEQGIIHRDLKPANVKVRPDGTVKVLDFGLAKAFDPTASSGAGATMSPTLSIHATQAGIILGTAAYMAPEQARGKAVDKRADIWAFGCVLFEMLTGRRAFDGGDISTTLAAVLKTDPDWQLLPVTTPTGLRRLLVRCLKKDPKDRLQAVGDARVELGELLSGPSENAALLTITPGRATLLDRFRVFTAGALLAFVATAAVAGWRSWGHRAAEPAKVAFEIVTDFSAFPNQFTLSPDGTRLVAVIVTDSGPALWLRRLDEVEGHILGATTVTGGFYPFWSADSRFLAFFADGKLNKIDASGGPVQALCDVQVGKGGTWNRDGVILFGASDGPLFSVAAGGGLPRQVTALDRARGDAAHVHPKFLPDGRHFIFLVQSTKAENTGLYLGSLGSQETRRLVASNVMGVFAAPDHLLFARDTTLMAQRFDTRRFELEGDPVPVAQDIGLDSSNGVVAIAASDTGVLAYRTGAAQRVLRWVDRTGKLLSQIGEVGSHSNAALAPGGDQLAEGHVNGGTSDIWIVDLQRGSSSRFTFGQESDGNPIWSPDKQQILFASARSGGVRNLYLKNASGAGSEELLLKTDRDKFPTDWSRDGQYILYTELSSPRHVWALPMRGDRKPIPVLNTSANEYSARLSPDGYWIAYDSDETGGPRVYVQTFPPGGGKWQVSISGTNAYDPRWRGDGRELFYLTSTGVWSVDVTTTMPRAFTTAVPRKLFDTNSLVAGSTVTRYDVTADGQRLLLNVENFVQRPIRVVLNWATTSKP
jgi:Tol biopolymer transport system component